MGGVAGGIAGNWGCSAGFLPSLRLIWFIYRAMGLTFGGAALIFGLDNMQYG